MRRNILIGILVIIVLAGAASIAAATGLFGSGSNRRNTGAVPRYIDIWAVYPDDTVRFVTIFHPLIAEDDLIVEVAGPLATSEDDVLNTGIVGEGALADLTYESGPEADSAYVYPLFQLARTAGSEAEYGIDVEAQNVPYLSTDPLGTGDRTISLGIKTQDYYEQVIVAVALPAGTSVTETPDLQPYRQATVGGWDVYYFDTTSATTQDVIRLTYTPVDRSVDRSLNYERIDAQR